MTIHIVTVQSPLASRYIDSLWVVKQHAHDRASQLKDELTRAGLTVNPGNWWVWSSEATAQDAQLKVKKESKNDQPA